MLVLINRQGGEPRGADGSHGFFRLWAGSGDSESESWGLGKGRGGAIGSGA